MKSLLNKGIRYVVERMENIEDTNFQLSIKFQKQKSYLNRLLDNKNQFNRFTMIQLTQNFDEDCFNDREAKDFILKILKAMNFSDKHIAEIIQDPKEFRKQI